MMEICMIGVGYVGLVTGTCFAHMGHQVWCVDMDQEKINQLEAGVLPIYEPGLGEMVAQNRVANRLFFTTDLCCGLNKAEMVFITVGTPAGKDGCADLSYVFKVADEIGQKMNSEVIIVMKSTVPVGTAEKVKLRIQEQLVKRGQTLRKVIIASNPEFLREGAGIVDFMYPDRIIIGTGEKETAQRMEELYQPIVQDNKQIVHMDNKSAELTKYVANTMLATRISFMNEVAGLCDQIGGDIQLVRAGIGTDQRIGPYFLDAGTGYGGSCFPKDVQEFLGLGRKHGLPMAITQAVQQVNEKQKQVLVEMVRKRYGENLVGKKIGIWGLAFKAQTDDMREAPSLVIIPALIHMGAHIVVYDPEAMGQGKILLAEYSSQIQYASTSMEGVEGVDGVLLITEWQEFRQPDFQEMLRRMKVPLIFDGRNQYEPSGMKNLGFEYYCIGRNCNVQ
jgi:UDPglucose 6-dehydrogenase